MPPEPCPAATAYQPALARHLPRGAPASDHCEERFRFVGLDPGQVNGATCAEQAKRGEGNRLGRGARPAAKTPGRRAARARYGPANDRGKCTATYLLTLGQYHHQAGHATRMAQAALWAREVAAENDLLSTVTRKTARPATLGRYHAVLDQVADARWASRSKARVGNAEFTFWQRSTSALDSFAARVHRGRARDGTLGFKGRTVVAYGTGARGGVFPTVQLREAFGRALGAARVVDTDEFMTSQRHWGGQMLDGIPDKNHNMRGHLRAP